MAGVCNHVHMHMHKSLHTQSHWQDGYVVLSVSVLWTHS